MEWPVAANARNVRLTRTDEFCLLTLVWSLFGLAYTRRRARR